MTDLIFRTIEVRKMKLKKPTHITKDMVIEAVWEYKTTDGIIYSSSENQNFAEIEGAYKYISGEVYLGAYFGDKKILGICDRAFADCSQITKVYQAGATWGSCSAKS